MTNRDSFRVAIRSFPDAQTRARILERFSDLDAGADRTPPPDDLAEQLTGFLEAASVLYRIDGQPDAMVLELARRQMADLPERFVSIALEWLLATLAGLPLDPPSLWALARRWPLWFIDALWSDDRPTPSSLATWCHDWEIPDEFAACSIDTASI